MTKELWINLPVKNVKKSLDFFTQIGFILNKKHPPNEEGGSLLVGDKGLVIMLFQENTFKGFVQNELIDAKKGSEVLFSIDAQSEEEVDQLAKQVIKAGGKIFSEPQLKNGWMYGCGFIDLDNHRWNILYMNFEKMPEKGTERKEKSKINNI